MIFFHYKLSLVKIILILLAIGGLSEPVAAQDGSGGQAGELLRYGVGAKALAMHGTYTSVSDDASAVYWNPAGLSQLNQTAVGFMYSQLFYDTEYQFFGIASPALSKFIRTPGFSHSVGLGIINLQQDGFVGRDPYNEKTGTFGIQEFAVMVPYAVSTIGSWGSVSLGVKPQLFGQTIQNQSGYGVGLDMGMLYQPMSPRRYALLGFIPLRYLMPWRVGFNLKYLSPVTLMNTPQEYPNSINFGISNAAFEDLIDLAYPWGDPLDDLPVKVLLSYEYQHMFGTSRDPQHTIGGEVTLGHGDFLVSLPRFGYQFNRGQPGSGFSYGAGFRYKGMEIEYAQIPHADLDMAHHLYFTYHFGRKRHDVKAVKNPATYSSGEMLSHLAEYPFDNRVIEEHQGVDTLYKSVVAENLLYRSEQDTFLADRYDRFIGGFRRIDNDARAALGNMNCTLNRDRFVALRNRYERRGFGSDAAAVEQLSSETYFTSLSWYLKILLVLGQTDSVQQIVEGDMPGLQNPQFRTDRDARNYFLAYATKEPQYCEYLRTEYQPDNVFRDIFMSVAEAVYNERANGLDSLLRKHSTQVYHSHRDEYEPFPLICDGILADDILFITAYEQSRHVDNTDTLWELFMPIVFELPHSDFGKVLIHRLNELSSESESFQAQRRWFQHLWDRYRKSFLQNRVISAPELLKGVSDQNV